MQPLFVSSLLLAALISLPVQADPVIRFQSGDHRVHLLELFTSQGCSSCPPADHWLSGLVQDDRLWHRIVPVAWHVDYWDWMGWRDRFSDPANSARQRAYLNQGLVHSVYTPGFVVDGHEWKGWFSRRQPPLPEAKAGNLAVTISGGKMQVTFAGTGQSAQTAHVVVLGFGLATPVARGENSSRTLREDFVTLWHQQQRAEGADWQFVLPDPARFKAERLAIAVWVNGRGSAVPLQVTGGWWP